MACKSAPSPAYSLYIYTTGYQGYYDHHKILSQVSRVSRVVIRVNISRE